MTKNEQLQHIDDAVQLATLNPQDQMGLLVLALALAMRRFLKRHNITDRGRRMKLVKSTVAEIDSKLRTHGNPDVNEVLTIPGNEKTMPLS